MHRVLVSLQRWHVIAMIGVAAVFFGACGPAQSDPIAPKAQDKQIAIVISTIIPNNHLSQHALDDEISERGLELFLKSLDPRKLYFYQSDIDEFMQYEDQLDDRVKRGDLSVAYAIFDRFLQRVDERSETVQALLPMRHDFTANEEIIVDKDKLTYPRTPAEAQDRWRKRVKLDLLADKAERIAAKKAAEENGEPYEEDEPAVEKLSRRYRSIQKRYHQIDSDDLLEMFLTAIISGYDPHTSYMSPSTHKNFIIHMGLKLQGIGATLQSEDGYTIVKSLVPGGAADKQGDLKPEDKIVAVGQGQKGEMVDVVDMKLDDVVGMIRGEPGTTVRLKIERRGAAPQVIKIVRAKIELKDSEAQSEVFEAGKKPDGSPMKIGVIDLPSFYLDMEAAQRGDPNFKSTTRDVRAILEKFKKENVDGVILDLRLNGGGSLQEAIGLTGLFIENGPVVQVKGADGSVYPYRDNDRSIVWDGPMMVLVSKFSASASEILAGAIQDYRRGLVVGDKATHGKGTVQSLSDLGRQLFGAMPNTPALELGAIKVTMQQFYRPSGDSTQKRGVVSDIELPSLTTHYDVAEADLDYPVEFDRVDPAHFTPFEFVTKPLVDQLMRSSQTRRAESEDFEKLMHDIDLYLEQKEKDAITLNETQFLKEREELYADQKEQETFEDLAGNGTNSNIERNFYLDEAISIMVDYIDLLDAGGYEYTPTQQSNAVIDFLFGM